MKILVSIFENGNISELNNISGPCIKTYVPLDKVERMVRRGLYITYHQGNQSLVLTDDNIKNISLMNIDDIASSQVYSDTQQINNFYQFFETIDIQPIQPYRFVKINRINGKLQICDDNSPIGIATSIKKTSNNKDMLKCTIFGNAMVIQDGSLHIGDKCVPSINGIATLSPDENLGFQVVNVINNRFVQILAIDKSYRLLTESTTSDIDAMDLYNKIDLRAYDEYHNEQVKSITNKLSAINANLNANICFITDIHTNSLLATNVDVEDAMKNTIYSINEINNTIGIDVVVNNGDNIESGGNKDRVLKKYTTITNIFKKSDSQVLVARGNHDDNGYGNEDREAHIIYDTERHMYLAEPFFNDRIIYDIDNKYRTFFYYDILKYKIRVIIINTCDFQLSYTNGVPDNIFGTSGISGAQLEFIANSLIFGDTGWSVLFIGHHCLRRTSNMGTTNSGINLTNNGDVLWGLITAYKNKTVYNSNNPSGYYQHDLSVDFTNNMSNDVICCLSGHTHSDKTDVVNGIRLISTTSASVNRDTVRIPRTSNETSADIISIDRIQRTLNIFRFGYGADRTLTY